MKGSFASSLTYPAVVGTVHSRGSLAAARRIRDGQCDWLELRVDNFFPNVAQLRNAAANLRCPRIITVRHPSEGGAAKSLTARERRDAYSNFLEIGQAIDIELRQAGSMKQVIREARSAGVGIILSHHNFQKTAPVGKLRELAVRAGEAGADLFKVATLTKTARDLATLLEFLGIEKKWLPLAVMGMGPYGKISRLALAQAGSRLNYGYLGTANASGQWPVALLRARIAELQSDGA